MEVRFEHHAVAKCHPRDLWHVFAKVETWHHWCQAFGDAGWVRGEAWKEASRFVLRMKVPREINLEIVVLRCRPSSEVVLLCHSETVTVQQWISFTPDPYGDTSIQSTAAFVGGNELTDPGIAEWVHQVNELWLQALSCESEKHCVAVAL